MFDFSEVKNYDSEIAEAMEHELTRQRTNLELIASENLVSKAVMAAMGSRVITVDASMSMWWKILPLSVQKNYSDASMPMYSRILEHRQIWQSFLR